MHDTVSTLIARNRRFVEAVRDPGITMMPTLRTIVVGCADPRVDPAHVLGLAAGEALVIRNIGGRITPATVQTMGILGMIARAEGGNPAPGWNLVVLQHTDCGITRLVDQTEALAAMFGIAPSEVAARAVADPHAAVAVDVAALHANQGLPADFLVSGLVFDVMTGLVDVVEAPAPLRNTAGAA